MRPSAAFATLPSVGDLAEDTAIERVGEGRYRRVLSRDWEIWGPNGGYIAAVCLRAAGAACGLDRPATLACHFLSVGRFEEAELDVDVLRSTKRTAAVRVHMHQGGAPIAEATVWAAAAGLDGYEWHDQPAPDVPHWRDTPTIQELLSPEQLAEGPSFAFWHNLEERPLEWIPQEAWLQRRGLERRQRSWHRFTPGARYDDPWVDACRSTILLDTWCWPAAARGLSPEEQGRFMAPSLDVTIRFHDLPAASEWLLVEARAPYAGGGLIGAQSDVWSDDGRLVASAGSQLFCRPAPA